MWCIPEVTEEFKKKMFDVLEVYERPYNPEKPVICFDEKNKQLLRDKNIGKAVKKGKPRRRDYEYIRNGAVNLFVLYEYHTNERYIRVTKRRTKKDFAKMIKYLVVQKYKKAKKVVLVTDNLNTHNKTSLIETFGKKEGEEINRRIEWHYTPKHASWLNMAELEISAIETQLLRNNRIGTFHEMQKQIFALVKERNKNRNGVKWTFTRRRARDKFEIKQYRNSS